MAFCKNCGNKLNEGDIFCGKCGWKAAVPLEKKDPASYFFLGIKKYFSFRGTASRKEFLWYICYQMIVFAGIFTARFIDRSVLIRETVVSDILKYIMLACFLFFLLPNISIAVRRLHDTNRRGWWLLVPVLEPLLCLLKSKDFKVKPGKLERILGKVLALLFVLFIAVFFINGILYTKAFAYIPFLLRLGFLYERIKCATFISGIEGLIFIYRWWI